MQIPFDDELLKNQRVLWLTVVEQAMRDTMESKPSVRRKAGERPANGCFTTMTLP
jgi:hypothetical protein